VQAPSLSPPVAEPQQARSWLDAQLACLVAAAGYASAHGWSGHVTRLSAAMTLYLDSSGHHSEALAIHGHAVTAARAAGDKSVRVLQGRYAEAMRHYEQARTLYRETGNRVGEFRNLFN
jgi:hypothetical protein